MAFGSTLAGLSWLWVQHGASQLEDCCPGPTMGSGVPTPKGAWFPTRGKPRDCLPRCSLRRWGVLGYLGVSRWWLPPLEFFRLISAGVGIGYLLSGLLCPCLPILGLRGTVGSLLVRDSTCLDSPFLFCTSSSFVFFSALGRRGAARSSLFGPLP